MADMLISEIVKLRPVEQLTATSEGGMEEEGSFQLPNTLSLDSLLPTLPQLDIVF